MHEVYLNSMRDTILVGVPFIAVLALGIFRLDTFFLGSKPRPTNTSRQGCGLAADGEPIVVDPDGQIARRKRR